MGYAVIKTGGKQYRVKEGDTLNVEKLEAEVGQELELGGIVLLNRDGKLTTAADKLKGLSVKAKVIGHGRGKKIKIYKFKRRKGYELHKGHRQAYTRIQISAVP